MKKGLLCRIILALGFIAVMTSCDSDDDYWYGPSGWESFNDSRLYGTWMLVQYNSEPVTAGDVNYMQFNGNGYGRYFYLEGGQRYTEQIQYWCQNSVSGASNYQINVRYASGSLSTMSYWFTHGNNTLWLQWQTGGGRVQTYVYDRVSGVPW